MVLRKTIYPDSAYNPILTGNPLRVVRRNDEEIPNTLRFREFLHGRLEGFHIFDMQIADGRINISNHIAEDSFWPHFDKKVAAVGDDFLNGLPPIYM